MNSIHRVQKYSIQQIIFNFFSILKCGRIIRIHHTWARDKSSFRLEISDWLPNKIIFIMQSLIITLRHSEDFHFYGAAKTVVRVN